MIFAWPLAAGSLVASDLPERPRRGTRIVSKGAPSRALVPPRLGTAGKRHSGRLAPAPALAAQHAHSEALDLAPNNSMEPTRPARCLVWRDTSLGWPGGSSRGRCTPSKARPERNDSGAEPGARCPPRRRALCCRTLPAHVARQPGISLPKKKVLGVQQLDGADLASRVPLPAAAN